MGEHADPTLTPERAVQALSELEGYEERLTVRTAGLTWMIWGLTIPGIFLAYNTAAHWTVAHGGPGWLYPVLWVPFIAGAVLASRTLWEGHAVALGLDDQEREDTFDWLWSALFTLAFFAIAGALLLSGIEPGPNAFMAITTGLFTMVLGVAHRYWHGAPVVPTLVAGAAIVTAGVLLGLSSLPDPARGLAGAGAVAASYFALGGLYLRRG